MSKALIGARAATAVLLATTVCAASLGPCVRYASAQTTALRDPTQPPPGYGAGPAPAVDPVAGFRPEYILAVDGRRYLVLHGRRYAVGDSIEGARIERIDDQAVWVRTAQGVRELKLFEGVEKNDRERAK